VTVVVLVECTVVARSEVSTGGSATVTTLRSPYYFARRRLRTAADACPQQIAGVNQDATPDRHSTPGDLVMLRAALVRSTATGVRDERTKTAEPSSTVNILNERSRHGRACPAFYGVVPSDFENAQRPDFVARKKDVCPSAQPG
jgi:hypothetical protein